MHLGRIFGKGLETGFSESGSGSRQKREVARKRHKDVSATSVRPYRRLHVVQISSSDSACNMHIAGNEVVCCSELQV